MAVRLVVRRHRAGRGGTHLLIKARKPTKYIRRWRGADATWRYEYASAGMGRHRHATLAQTPAAIARQAALKAKLHAHGVAVTTHRDARPTVPESHQHDHAAPVATAHHHAPVAARPLPQIAPGTPLAQALAQIESVICHHALESAHVFSPDGTVRFQKSGEQSAVSFDDNERAMLRGAIATHNHPNEGVSFSPNDIGIAAQEGIKELRAVGARYLHRLELLDPNKLPTTRAVQLAFDRHKKRLMPIYRQKIRDGEDVAAANHAYTHELNNAVVDGFPGAWRYTRTLRDDRSEHYGTTPTT